MKNISLALNVVLLVAVGALYYLQFAGSDSAVESGIAGESKVVAGNGGVVYVNIDSLINKYDLFYDMQAELAKSQQESEAEFKTKSISFEKEAADFQNKVQKGLVTRSQAQKMESELMAKQQQLIQLREQLRLKLVEKEQVMMRKLQNEIAQYVAEYNKVKGYNYVLSRTYGGPVLFANDALDITEEIIAGLNKNYISERENTK
ncbi:MAG: OmpH family outer membrane protein [Bacteroidales bacterium]|jgi:outer membrane protein|nr:OmpH family outer membrane protein [Bacteroidales bacterium]